MLCHFLTFRPAPVTLTNQKAARQNLRVNLAALLVDNRLLGLNDGTGLALVIDSNHLVAQLKLPPSAGWWEGLQDCELALAVNAVAVVQIGNTGDVDGLLACIEISHLLIGELES